MSDKTYNPLQGQVEQSFSSAEVSARQTQQALLNVFFLASSNSPPGTVQPFDAFALGALTAYLSEREADFNTWYKGKVG